MGNYFFWGQEEYLINEEINKFKEKYLDENFSSMNLRYFYSPSYQELSNILHTTGTMFGNIINIINCDEYVFSKAGSTTLSDSDIEHIKDELNLESDNVHNLFVLKIPRDIEYKKLSSVPSKPIAKLLIKNTQSKEFKQYRDFDKELVNWIIKRAKVDDLVISTDNAKFLINKLGVNLTLLSSEITKLKLSIYPDNKISQEHIIQYTTATEDIFRISDLIISGRRDLAALEYNKAREKNHYLPILAQLQSAFSKLIDMKLGIETMTLTELAIKLGMKEYPLKLQLQKLGNTNLNELIRIKKNLIKAEEAIKIDFSIPDLEIEKAILSDV